MNLLKRQRSRCRASSTFSSSELALSADCGSRHRAELLADRAQVLAEGVARLRGQIEVSFMIRSVECPKDALLRDQEFGDRSKVRRQVVRVEFSIDQRRDTAGDQSEPPPQRRRIERGATSRIPSRTHQQVRARA